MPRRPPTLRPEMLAPAPPPRRGPVRFLVHHFVRGLLFVVPLAATIWGLFTVFHWVDRLIPIPVEGSFHLPLFGEVQWKTLANRGAGFVITVAGVILVGFLTSNVLTGWFLRLIEELLTRLPVIKVIYTWVKDLLQAFVSEEKKFDKPVLLSFGNEPDVEVIGFVTREDLKELGRPDKIAVYVPQSYNFAANLILVPRERVQPIELPAGDVMAFVVSGGVTGGVSADAEDEEG